MPHIHIFMDQGVIEPLGLVRQTGAYSSYLVDRDVTVERFVGGLVKDAFYRHVGEVLSDDQVINYDLVVTHSMPADIVVNITAWYTPDRAPHFDAIEQDVRERLQEWAPHQRVEVHLVVVGAPK